VAKRQAGCQPIDQLIATDRNSPDNPWQKNAGGLAGRELLVPRKAANRGAVTENREAAVKGGLKANAGDEQAN
jgi:hypothetical protein